jgi:hypothetical protein
MVETVQQGALPHFYYMYYMINWLFAEREDETRRAGRVKVEGDGSNRVWVDFIQTYHKKKYRGV